MSTSRVYTVGQVLTAAQVNDLPQGILTVAKVTANSAAISTVETDVITASAVTIAGTTRRLRLTFVFRDISLSVPGDLFVFSIKEGATVLMQAYSTTAGGTILAIVDSPTAASHTYKVSLVRVAGTGTATVEAGATFPMTLTVEDAGQV